MYHVFTHWLMKVRRTIHVKMMLRSNVLFQPGPIIFLQVLPDDLVPVLEAELVVEGRVGALLDTLKRAIDVLIVEDVEQFEEEEAITEVFSDAIDLPAPTQMENFIYKKFQITPLLQN